MSLKYGFFNVEITCDKCGHSQTESKDSYNDEFFKSGWGLYPNAKKYIHKCRDCQSAKHRKAHDFVAANFPIKNNS